VKKHTVYHVVKGHQSNNLITGKYVSCISGQPPQMTRHNTLYCIHFSFFISLSFCDLFLPTSFRCRGLLLYSITPRHTTISIIPLDEGSAHRRDLYLTTLNTYNRQTHTPSAGSEPPIPTSDRSQIQQLDRAANIFRCCILY